jgi:hypothetical protein
MHLAMYVPDSSASATIVTATSSPSIVSSSSGREISGTAMLSLSVDSGQHATAVGQEVIGETS